MPRRSTVWRVAVGAFTLINFAGFIYAGFMGEPMHAAVHAMLTVLGGVAYGVLHVRSAPQPKALPQETAERLKHLEQSVDALAIGVERVGEAQRYQTKILDEKSKANAGIPAAPPKKDR